MIIALGSASDEKKNILYSTLDLLKIKANVLCYDVTSKVADQPLDGATTIKGATNRSQSALGVSPKANIGVGLEGGLIPQGNNYSLFCVCVISTPEGKTYTGTSLPISLPPEVATKVSNGAQFGTAIREFRKEHPNDNSQIIDELVSRQKSFNQAIKTAFGLYLKKCQKS